MALTGTPVKVTIRGINHGDSHPAYLWADGTVTRDAAGTQLASAEYQPGGRLAPSATSATGTSGTGATAGTTPGATGNTFGSPPPTGLLFTQPAGDPYGAAARFGGVPGGALQPYSYNLYTGAAGANALPGPGGSPIPPATATPSAAAPLPSSASPPSPAPAPAPVPNPAPGSGSGAGLLGLGGGTGSREGETASPGSPAGSGGRFSATPTANSIDIAAQQGQTPGSMGYLDLGSVGSNLLGAAATVAPGWAGLGLGALQAGGRLYNTSVTDQIRAQQGLPPLDAGQWAGSAIGGNKYGNLDAGDATIANPEQYGAWQRALDAKQTAGAGPMTGMFGTNALGVPTGETTMGKPYQSGPGGLLGLIFGGGAQPAASVATTNDQLSGADTLRMLMEETGLPQGQAAALLARDQPGNAGGALGLGGVTNPGSSGASMTTGAAGVRGIGAGNLAPSTRSAAKIAADAFASAQNHAASGGFAQSGTDRSALGPGTGFNPGGGTLAAGDRGTGGLATGFGGGGYAKGGYVGQAGDTPPWRHAGNAGRYGGAPYLVDYGAPTDTAGAPRKRIPGYDEKTNFDVGGRVLGRPDRLVDNHRINANEGEFIIRNSAAAAAGPRLLGMMNTPAGAKRVRSLLGL